LVDGKHVKNPVEGSGRVSGVEGREHEVAGFCGGECEGDRLEVSHFPDHDDVGIFPQSSAQGLGEGLGVRMNFALIDVAAQGFEDVLDGVFQGEDVILAILVNEIDQGGESGGLSGAHRTGHEEQAVVIPGERNEVVDRKAKGGKVTNGGADDPEDDVDPEALLHHRGPETALGIGVGKVDVSGLLETIPFLFCQEGFC
jgi:hypothetical protein